MLYFAFGSNLLPSRLQRRCPSASVKTRAMAPGYRVVFDKLSEDSSGKANLVDGNPHDAERGVVYELAVDDVTKLDAFEGPGYRRRDDFVVTCLDSGAQLAVCTYVAKKRVPGLRPFDWYLALVLAGFAHHDIDSSYARIVRRAGFDRDAQRARRTRLNALQDLEEAGYADYRTLLRLPA